MCRILEKMKGIRWRGTEGAYEIQTLNKVI